MPAQGKEMGVEFLQNNYYNDNNFGESLLVETDAWFFRLEPRSKQVRESRCEEDIYYLFILYLIREKI